MKAGVSIVAQQVCEDVDSVPDLAQWVQVHRSTIHSRQDMEKTQMSLNS